MKSYILKLMQKAKYAEWATQILKLNVDEKGEIEVEPIHGFSHAKIEEA